MVDITSNSYRHSSSSSRRHLQQLLTSYRYVSVVVAKDEQLYNTVQYKPHSHSVSTNSSTLVIQSNLSYISLVRLRDNHTCTNMSTTTVVVCVCVCVCVFFPSILDITLDVPAGVTQEEGHTGFLIHLPSAVRALIFVARRIQPFLSLVDREVEFCVLTN